MALEPHGFVGAAFEQSSDTPYEGEEDPDEEDVAGGLVVENRSNQEERKHEAEAGHRDREPECAPTAYVATTDARNQ